MKWRIRTIIFSFLILIFISLQIYPKTGDEKLSGIIDSIASGASSAWDGAGNMLKGMGQSIGIVTSDYHYSYRIFNDSPAPVFAVEQRITSIMGPTFHFGKKKGLVIGPSAESGQFFYKRQLYIAIWICFDRSKADIKKYAKSSVEWRKEGAIVGAVVGMGVASPVTTALGAAVGALAGGFKLSSELEKYKIFEKDIAPPWPANDDNMYYYHVFKHAGKVDVESLGLAGTSTEFSGQFYYSGAKEVIVTFTKDGLVACGPTHARRLLAA